MMQFYTIQLSTRVYTTSNRNKIHYIPNRLEK